MTHQTTASMRSAIFGAWLIVVFLVAPIFVVVPYSLTPERYLSMPDGNISFTHYQAIIEDSSWLLALRDSAGVAISSMVLATLLGTSAAIGAWKIGGSASKLVGTLAMFPMIVPSIVTALALSRSWVSLGLFDTFIGVVISHAIIGLPFVYMTVTAALEGLDSRMLQAARSLGAGSSRAVRDVVLPNIKAGVYSGALFAFFTSWDEVVVTMFVSARSVFTLPRKILASLRENIDPTVTSISTVMILITVVVAIIYLFRSSSRGALKD